MDFSVSLRTWNSPSGVLSRCLDSDTTSRDNVRIMDVDGAGAGDRLSSGNSPWLLSTIDQSAKDRSGWIQPFDYSSTADDAIPLHVKRWYGKEYQLLVLQNRAGKRITDELGDESRNDNSAVAIAT